MAPPKTTNETEVEDIEVVNFEPQDEEGMDIDGGSVGAEASAPNPNNKSRSLCSGKVLAGGIIAASALAITGLAVDNSAKSEFIQAHQSESTWGTAKASKGEGPGPGGKASKGGGPPPPPCEDMVHRCFVSFLDFVFEPPIEDEYYDPCTEPQLGDYDDELCRSRLVTTIKDVIPCLGGGDACCYGLDVDLIFVYPQTGLAPIEPTSSAFGVLDEGVLSYQYQACGDGFAFSGAGAYDMNNNLFSILATDPLNDDVFYRKGVPFTVTESAICGGLPGWDPAK